MLSNQLKENPVGIEEIKLSGNNKKWALYPGSWEFKEWR